MKKITALILAIILCFTLAIPAFGKRNVCQWSGL